MSHPLFDSLSGNISSLENQSAIQSILETTAVPDSGTTQVEDEDVFQCGKCKKQFSNLSQFVSHKQSRCTSIAPRLPLQNTTLIHSLGGSAFTSTGAPNTLRAQIPQSVGGYGAAGQGPITQLTQNLVLTDDQMLAFSDLSQTVQNGILQGSTLHLGPANTVQTNGSFIAPVSQLPPRVTSNVTILSAIQPTTSLSASSGSAFTSPVTISNLQPLMPQQHITIATLPEKPQNLNIIKPSPTKAARKSAQASAQKGEEQDNSGYTEDGKKKLVCTYCNKVFTKNFDLQQHVRSHTGEKPFQCVVCGRAFAQKSNVKKHMSTHKVWPTSATSGSLPTQPPAVLIPIEESTENTAEKEADTCEQPNQTEVVLEQPAPEPKQKLREKRGNKKEQYKVKVIVDNSYICQYCPEKFKSYYQLKSHMVKHKGHQVYKCVAGKCGKTFKDLDSYIEHVTMHKEDMTYRCHKCSKIFQTLYELGVHQYTHSLYQSSGKSGPWHYQCNLCMNKYATPEALQHHMSTTSHKHPCPHCQKMFTCERFLRKHLTTHDSENQYECQTCFKKFKTEHYLKSHILIHTGEKPFPCDTCGASFNRKDKLKRHQLIHDAKIKYRCPFRTVCGCTKEFVRPDKLKAHLMTHSNVKPFSCELCGKDFLRKPHYTEHMRSHNQDYPYNCENCKRGFFRPKLFKEHRCVNAKGEWIKKRAFQPRRMRRKPGRPRKVIKTDKSNQSSKNVYLNHSKEKQSSEEGPKQDNIDVENRDKSENEPVDEEINTEESAKSESIEQTLGESQENSESLNDKEQAESEYIEESEETRSYTEPRDLDSEPAVKKPKTECYVKISPNLVPVSVVERYVTVQYTPTNSGDGTDIQTQVIPASELPGHIQFTSMPGGHIQISPSSSATAFHPIQIIEGQQVTFTVSQSDQLGDMGVGEPSVIDIPVDIVTVSSDEAMLCAQEVTNDCDATEQGYSTLSYAPDHLINSSVEMLSPENM